MINNGGLAVHGPLLQTTQDDFDRTMDTNVKGGKMHQACESADNASEWAVNGVRGTLRLDAPRYGVEVSCGCPGGVDAPFWEEVDVYLFPTDRLALEGDFMKPEDLAVTVIHLAQGADAYVLPEVVMVPLLPQMEMETEARTCMD